MEEQFWSVINSYSSKPFHVNTGKGNIWYYLKHGTDSKLISRVVGNVHNCNSCRRNSKLISGYFGPNEYAVNFGLGPNVLSDCYEELENSRIISRSNCNQPSGVMIITDNSILKPKRISDGKKDEFRHFSFNMKPEHITQDSVYNGISDVLLKKLENGSMDTRLDELITNLQLTPDGLNSDMKMLESVLEDKNLFRKDFWKYRIEYAKRVQKYASRFPNGDNFKKMDPFHKMHVRIFALFYGGSYSYSENLMFKAVSHLVDCSKDVYNGGTLVTFMNSRSDPDTYMVQQVARALETHSIQSRFTVSLAWSSTSDLDLWIKTPNGEIINHVNRESKTCNTKLDFDANSQTEECMENPVENITLDWENFGKYDVYVNNFQSRNGEICIPFIVVVSLDGEREVFESSWATKKKSNGKLKNMVNVTSVYISEMMVRKLKPPEMSAKKIKSFSNLLEGFGGLFGNIRTQIVNIETLSNTKHINLKMEKLIHRNIRGMNIHQIGNIVSSERKRTTISQRTGGDFTKISDIINSKSKVYVSINAKDFPPSVLTKHSCDNVLKYNVIVNTYYEKGSLPTKPNPDRRFVFSRIDNEWNKNSRINIISITRLPSGYFLCAEEPRLPKQNSEWIIGAGMYVDDLKSEYHKFRELWKTHHISTPLKIDQKTTPAIGIFMCNMNSHRIRVNGIDMVIKSE